MILCHVNPKIKSSSSSFVAGSAGAAKNGSCAIKPQTTNQPTQYCKPPQFTDKEPIEASNFVTKQSNITVTKHGTKSAHVCSVGLVQKSMAAFPPEKAKVLQSLESDADAEMSSSSASEGDTLEYYMSEDLEDMPQNVCPTTPPPPSTARQRVFF
ncbi:hypothetical protein AVEN_78201-1 [Araneus ventricosus]|uniref:Uncharacterized protein n=1 Tax=Araneus ventricosus TaxID=182803 RepID=A0A4Y2R7E9_ARAVE|nr:hypothetical protein AVEN_78201-1 [Araneus ventricosus]